DVIGNTYTAIKTWIHAQYNAGTPTNPAPSFFLLVGDTPQIPATTGSSSAKMTDLYYASVDGDYFPEMYYGRFSARTVEQLIPQIQKTLYYEKYEFTDPSYLDKTTLIAGSDGTWNPRVGQPTIHYGTQNYFNTAHGYTDVNTYLTSPYTGCYDPSRIAVGFINYTAHCAETSWGDPLLSQSAVNNFTNTGKFPLAVGNCCLAADFGYAECIGETWQRAANKGSVAYIGSSPSSYWFEDFYWAVGAFPIVGTNNGYVPTYNETSWGAYDAPFVSNYVSAGAMVFVGNLAVTKVHIQGYPTHSSPLYYWQAYNVLGDPSLVTYHTQGSTNTVSHLPILPIGLTTYEVTADQGSYVAISKDGFLHGTALVGPDGVVMVPIQPVLSSGMVDIVVTKPQFIPYMAQVPAAALQGPYVVLDSYTINDASGNNNGLADYGENISLNVTLKNVGADPSGVVTTTLSGSDQYITLTGSATQNFSAIPNGQTGTLSNAFSFSIADFVPDQHKATFVLQMTDGSGTWTSTLRITLQAPVLSIPAGFLVDDSQGGNNDGILDPGETALVKVNVKNTGSSAVSNVVLSIGSTNPMLVINTATVNVPSLAAGQTREASFSVSASASSPIGNPANVSLNLAAGITGQYTASQSIVVVIGLIPDYMMANTTVTTCVGVFYDTGGPNGSYGNSENLTMTFLPHTTGSMIRAKFVSFDIENTDKLYVYNGPNTTSPQFAGSPFAGTISPGTLTAQNAQGAITFRFTSDASITRAGWKAEINCHALTAPPACAATPTPANGAINIGASAALSWTAVEAHSYDVYFGPTPNPPFVANLTTTTYNPPKEPNTIYYWKVVPKNTIGSAIGCQVWSFTTGGPTYLMSTSVATVSSGIFYDSGGPNSNYSNNESHVMAFMPMIAGIPLKFTFTAFETENIYDKLFIYNGPDVNAPAFTGSPFQGANSPGTITSTHTSGAITFRFISDPGNTQPGWSAFFLMAGNLAAAPSASPSAICKNDFSLLKSNAMGGSGNYTYSWTPTDGLSNPAIANPVASPNKTTVYTVSVNDGTTQVTGQVQLVINQASSINLGADTTICLNHTLVLNASIPNGQSYLWSPGGQTTPVITVNSTGIGVGSRTYSVIATDINGCQTQASITVTFDACTFVEDLSKDLSITVYPNPARSVLNIVVKGQAESLAYSFLNHHGQVMLGRSVGKVEGTLTQQINLDNFAKGIYYLRLNTLNDVIVKKIVIQ
ncbi:MAG: C25 family cysteine peptidase, partial [Bacteroidales bacterium]|nr:C25 family cysteine peptidase [Bacteroidales bacterium]